ncbi:MAG: DUF1499 domain-containing protein [Oceanicaulis sp.]
MQKIFTIIRHLVVGLAAAAAILIPLWFVVTAFGGKFGLWTPLQAFAHVRNFAGMLLPAAAILGAAALVVAVLFRLVFGAKNSPGPGGYIAGIAALTVGLGGIAYAQSVRELARSVPPIHDITTDTENPPQFTQALIDRRTQDGARNSVDYASKVNPADDRPLPPVQAQYYPEITPIELPVARDLAYRAALNTARDMGWTVSTASEAAGMFEATATTFWFGFKDDIVVRVTDEGLEASRVDVRSVSRVGVSDLGANADRIERYSQRLRDSVGPR